MAPHEPLTEPPTPPSQPAPPVNELGPPHFDPQADRTVVEAITRSVPFIPSQCLFATFPTVPHYQCPWLSWSSTGNWVGYLNGALRCHFGQGSTDVWYPYTYLWNTTQAVRNVQAFFGLYVDGVCGPQTWNVIQWGVAGFPT